MKLNWIRSPLRSVTGLVQTASVPRRDIGIFNERYPISGCRWSIRIRPTDASGAATDSWGSANFCETKHEAVTRAEAMDWSGS